MASSRTGRDVCRWWSEVRAGQSCRACEAWQPTVTVEVELPTRRAAHPWSADAALLNAFVVALIGLMLGLPLGTRVWIAAGVTDMRRGMDSLAALVQTALGEQPFSGDVFVFRGKRGDLVKLLWWSGDGMNLYAKRLERGRFVWPQATSGVVHLSAAQLSMLLEGIDWRRPTRTWQPSVAA